MHNPFRAPSSPDRVPRAVWVLRVATVVSVVAVAALLAAIGWVARERAIDEGRARLMRLAQISQEQALRIVETNEVIARSVLAATEGEENAALRARAPQLHRLMRRLTEGLQQMQSIWIWDDNGRPVATDLRPVPPATLDISDRTYFTWARSTTASGWFISEPLRSRTTGQLFIDFSQRRALPDGRFAGALSVSLLPAYFDRFFEDQLAMEPGVSLALVRADGTLLSRYPAAPEGARLAPDSPLLAAMQAGRGAGETRGISSIDGSWRYVAYRRVGELPLYAVATARQDVLLHPWRSSMGLLVLVTMPLALALAALCWFALRRVQSEHAVSLTHRQELEHRLRAEEALRQSQKMEALGRLTGGVAHDFNNLMMVVQSSIAVARRLEQQGRPVAAALEPVERAIRSGSQLTRQLLAVARRQPLQVREVQLQEVVPAVAQLMGRTLGSAVQVTGEVAPQTGLVAVDQAELELALINLCINARDAMAGGSGTVRLTAEPAPPPQGADPGGHWTCLSVQDSGEGIAPENLPHVTEPFFTTKPPGKGTGLGLSQVASFVQQSGGRLEIRSAPGQGTTVAMLLPCHVGAAGPEPAVPGSLPVLEACLALVEDNPDIRASLQLLMEQAGARVLAFPDAETALAAVRAGTPTIDVVLSDINLGAGMGGVALARALQQHRPGLPVVLMTGYTDALQEAVALGFRVLPKPASPEELLRALQDALVRSSAAGA
jgi:two-component system NtrC family sensor kinase